MSNLTVFQFETQEVRFVGTADDPWWVAADICLVLGLGRDTHKHVQKLKPNEKTRKTFPGLDNPDGVWCVNEKGLYRLIFRSNKPNAENFQEWVFGEVLPSIRKTGKYQPQTESTLPTPEELSAFVELTIGGTGLDSKLIAGVKLNTIAKVYPKYAIAAEEVKKHISISTEAELLTATELAVLYAEKTGKVVSAIALNKLLENAGLQQKNPDSKNPRWLPVGQGNEFGQLVLDTAKGRDKTIQTLKWYPSVLEVLCNA